jgi:osmoprotectant transport system permease protein
VADKSVVRVPLALNPVAVALAIIALLCAWRLPFVLVAPNRLMSGVPVALADISGTGPFLLWSGTVFVGCAAWLLALTRSPRTTGLQWRVPLEIVCWVACAAGLIAGAGEFARMQLQPLSESSSPAVASLARVILGSAFWVVQGVIALLVLDALQAVRLSVRIKSLIALVLAAAWVLALFGVWGSALSVVVEYQQHRDELLTATLRHVQIVLTAMLPAVAVGLPLGWWIHRSPATRSWLMTGLGFTQTIPSLALFGLLMVPLAALSQRYTVLADWGIRGVGLAPAVLALWLYSLLPVVRGTLAGLASVSADACEAARAMGMRARQVAWHVELPLALPVLLQGLRTATNQAIGLAAVTALIGAGGLGAIMFDGLFSAAHDVVLLGVLPIIAMAWLADAAFQWASPVRVESRDD